MQHDKAPMVIGTASSGRYSQREAVLTFCSHDDMPPPLLFDISAYDLDQLQFGVDAIERVNPHRHQMRMLDGVIYMDEDRVIAFHDVRDDEFWVEGHIPGRPVMPGVLLIETAAQTASFYMLSRLESAKFMGFVGASDIKFRGQVVPGKRLLVLAEMVDVRSRRCVCKAQCLIDETMVFEGTITGMPM